METPITNYSHVIIKRLKDIVVFDIEHNDYNAAIRDLFTLCDFYDELLKKNDAVNYKIFELLSESTAEISNDNAMKLKQLESSDKTLPPGFNDKFKQLQDSFSEEKKPEPVSKADNAVSGSMVSSLETSYSGVIRDFSDLNKSSDDGI